MSRRQRARAERKASHYAARYAAADGDPIATEAIAHEEWRSVVLELPGEEAAELMSARSDYLRRQTSDLRTKEKR